MSLDGQPPTTYTCKCLNVRIRPQPFSEGPQSDSDPEYTPVYIGDEGITVVHPQVTLRTRSRGVPISGTSQCTRYTSLTCLICQTLVYRVCQVVPVDIEGKDGPQLPTDDWVELEIMKSSNGWIEVQKECLTGDAIDQAEALPSFSDTFYLVLHSDMLPPSPPIVLSPVPELHSQSPPFRPIIPPPSPSPPSAPHPDQPFLSNLRPLFPPAPFTPSHPAFLHFSNIASDKSQKLRTIAEEDLSKIVAEKLADVEQSEAHLRHEVEILWKKFRQGVEKVERDRIHNIGQPTSRPRGGDNSSMANKDGVQGMPIAIRDFVPVLSHPVKAPRTAHTHIPRTSSLSASLATSSFHYPKAEQQQISVPQHGSDEDSRPELSSPKSSSLSSTASRTISSQSGGSSKSSSLRSMTGAGRFPEPFKRSMDPGRDTAVSFQYFTILEADVARDRVRGKAKENRQDAAPELTTSRHASRGRSEVVKTITNGNDRSQEHPANPSQSLEVGAGEDNRGQQDGSKGKRKVTFDVKPEVVTIKREEDAEGAAAPSAAETGEMIFDLEDEGSERSFSEPASRPVLPLIEFVPFRPPRVGPNKTSRNAGLPESLVTLRPASLPLPSHVRPSRSHHGADTSQRVPQPRDVMPKKRPPEVPVEETGILNPAEAELLKLVAASTPSHRGAWRRDSKAWQLFVHRQDGKTGYSSIIPEETEDGDEVSLRNGMVRGDCDQVSESNQAIDAKDKNILVGSLPIAINPLSRRKEILNLASYQPQTLSEILPTDVSIPRRSLTSSAALRKAVYAERDRSRLMDPGALDFAAGEDEEDEDESDGDASKSNISNTGERGRKRALKILQARSVLPEEGMWRSLA